MSIANSRAGTQSSVRFEADEHPPPLVTWGLGLQLAILCIGAIVLTPVAVIRAAGGTEAFLTWAVFIAVILSGINTIFQAVKVGRIGSGYVLLMGTSGAFVAISIYALEDGGPALLCTLILISALFQFLISWRLSFLRRILNQTVAGTVIMLITVAVMPYLFAMLTDIPEGATLTGAMVSAVVTVAVMLGIALKATGALRLWGPVIGVIIGTITGAFYGLYDTAPISEAAWIGIPSFSGWPGFDLTFGSAFWGLLPAFVFVTLVGAIETIGDSIAIQKVSWRKPRATDFRAVQGAVGSDGLGNLFSGLFGTIPNTTYSGCVSVTELTGVASRRVGVAIGVIFVVTAFFPKLLAGVVAIPAPVAGGFLIVLLAMLFVLGMRIVVQEGINYRTGLVAGISFWIGYGFEEGQILPHVFEEFAGGIFANGMSAGGLVAIIMTLFMEVLKTRPAKKETTLETGSIPQLQKFVHKHAKKSGWGKSMAMRLELLVEEMMLTLMGDGKENEHPGRLLLEVREDGNQAVLVFRCTTDQENLQDQISLLSDQPSEATIEQEMSLRLLRQLSASVNHQAYHNVDIVVVRVNLPAGRSALRRDNFRLAI